MSAQILDLAMARPSSRTREPRGHTNFRARICQPQYLTDPNNPLNGSVNAPVIRETVEHIEFWTGASKERYVHTVYNLFDCPDLPQANFMLVRRAADGSRAILQIGHTACQSGSENLAMIRHKAAVLGANEVHVHYLQSSDKARDMVEFDLRAGQFGSLSAQPENLLH